MSAFEELGLHSDLCAVLEKNGIDLPTAIQQESIPLTLGGGDLCACAETGTGKTLSFIFSSLQIVHELVRNIGNYEDVSIRKNNNNMENNNDSNISNIMDVNHKNKKASYIKTINKNSKVIIKDNECICNNNNNNNSNFLFEEVKVDCEITNGLYAYEIEILSKSYVNVGFCPFIKETLKYNYTYCSNGNKYNNNRQEHYGEYFSNNDIITCLINKNNNTISFKKNGKFLGNAFKIFYKYNDVAFFPYIWGKYFHIKLHFENLKYGDRSLHFNELHILLTSNCNDSDTLSDRKIFFSSENIRDEKNLKLEKANMQTHNYQTNNSIINEYTHNYNQQNFNNKKKLYCIVLCPTRDLAQQTYNNYLTYSECFNNPSINIGILVGGEQRNKGHHMNDDGSYNIVVGTCFKLIECIRKNSIKVNDIRLLILDEADELINNDEKTVLEIKDSCMKYGHRVQTLFFSATLQDKNVKDCINKITNKPIFVDLKYGKNSIPSHIYVCLYYVNDENSNLSYIIKENDNNNHNKEIYNILYNEKLYHMNTRELYEYTDKVHILNNSNSNLKKNDKEQISLNIKMNKLKKLVQIINVFNMQNGIIFCRTNLDCDNVYNFLNAVGDGKAYKGTVESLKENKYSCVILKGKMSNDERKNNLQAFKKGEVRFLICTDVAARGIDIQNLRYLIIMTLSDNINTFFHKIGRVGRDGKNSLCIVLSADNEQEEKVWFHTCPSRGINCYNRNLKENKGCTVYIKESDYIKTINDMLEVPMHVLDSKYYYAENVVDPLNYFKKHPVSNKSRRNKNQNANSIFQESAHIDVLSSFASNINSIKKLQSAISYKHYELLNFQI
ncbi:DEAD/DEAH box ATP-dependent RNA helicase, putative [Plasmodium reichenowi]|uniref:ATP-dependent RNA helicase n=1 Tax=Plasmodium reichenowi TaxID=5854 RepID=A0A151LR50_PLARE|nr:DEAD/DEAH box ATP-dependent RNA helicase, putative [Plasmodium reichenowi]KYO01617.1 DEAD/DEAH box ATP-dependent RNA helicase, putative [Plasmodium reichenowi]